MPFVRPVWGAPELTNDGLVYLWVLAVFLVAYLAIAVLTRSPLGLTMRGTGDSEARLRALGYPVTRTMLASYTVSGALAGAAGAMWVSANGFITASDVNFTASAMALVAVVIGGLRSTWGAIAGTAVVVLVRDVLAPNLTGWWEAKGPLLLGLLLVLCVYLFPGGLSGLFSPTRSVLPLVVGQQRGQPDGGRAGERTGAGPAGDAAVPRQSTGAGGGQ